jgi:hypothetical protein
MGNDIAKELTKMDMLKRASFWFFFYDKITLIKATGYILQ